MPNPFRRSVAVAPGLLVPALLLCLVSVTAPQADAQSGNQPAAPVTGIVKQLNRIDFGISAAGILTNQVSGIEKRDQTPLTIKPSNTVGTLVTLRYTAKPYVGFEFNYAHSRYTQNYLSNPVYLVGGAQAGVNELTLGYVAHPPRIFGIQTYLGAGGGTLRFKPTPYGGQGLPEQYRAVYYYQAGVEQNFPDSHFGVRLGFRQLIYLAPDFLENYLTIGRRARTSEPTFGFFVRF